jgi:hypothetical protein
MSPAVMAWVWSGRDLPDWDWSDVPSWLALIGGIAAVLAFLAGRRDARRALASHVFVTCTHFNLYDSPTFTEVVVSNTCTAPIFEVRVRVHQWGRRHRLWRLRRSWWTGPVVEEGCRYIHTLAPRSAGRRWRLPAPDKPPGEPLSREEWPVPPVVMTFTDGNGRPWVRWPTGRLESARWVRPKARGSARNPASAEKSRERRRDPPVS